MTRAPAAILLGQPRFGALRLASNANRSAASGHSHPLRTAHARYAGDVAMRLAADIVLKPYVIAQPVDEARLPIPRVVFGIVNGDDVLELGRARLADALERMHLVAVRRA